MKYDTVFYNSLETFMSCLYPQNNRSKYFTQIGYICYFTVADLGGTMDVRPFSVHFFTLMQFVAKFISNNRLGNVGSATVLSCFWNSKSILFYVVKPNNMKIIWMA